MSRSIMTFFVPFTGSFVALQISLSDFLYKWLKLHVLGIDKKLEDFVMKSSVK